MSVSGAIYQCLRQNNIEFWDLRRLSDVAVAVTVYLKGYRKLVSLSDVAGFSIRPVKRAGVPVFLWRIRKRYALFAVCSSA